MYEVGQLVKVVKNDSNHRFEIGEVVRVKHGKCEASGDIGCEHLDGHDWWFVTESEIQQVVQVPLSEGAKAGQNLAAFYTSLVNGGMDKGFASELTTLLLRITLGGKA